MGNWVTTTYRLALFVLQAGVTPLEFFLGIAGTVVSGGVLAIVTVGWRITGDIRVMRTTLNSVVQDVEHIKSVIEQGRKWRWDAGGDE